MARQPDTVGDPRSMRRSSRLRLLVIFIIVVLLIAAFGFRQDILTALSRGAEMFKDQEALTRFIDGFGAAAPAAFIAFQIAQVLLAPVPGELSGFIGGYLFGAWTGFFYSTIGLTVGSWLNFIIGRALGKRYIRKLIPATPLTKFERLLKRQGAIVVFILFVFPGFPKDYLCLFLGLTSLPLSVFMVIAGIGRMPGTLMLSFQGAYLYEGQYQLFALLLVLTILLIAIVCRLREPLYRWIEKANKSR